MSTLFSIIIPTYNRADHLSAAIESVRAQTYPRWELIIVDDGSKDKTREVVLPYTSDVRIRYHHQKNRELNGARNSGVRLAKGQYCCFLDDDDYYEPNHLEELNAVIGITDGSHGIYRTNMRIVNGDTDSISPGFINDKDALVQLWETPRNLLPLAIRYTILANQLFDEENLLLDDFVWLNTALTSTTLFQTSAVTANYVLHPTNRSKLYHSVDLLPQLIRLLHEAYAVPTVSNRVGKALFFLRIQHQHFHLARLLAHRGEIKKALSMWIGGIRNGGIYPIRNTIYTIAIILSGK